MRRKLQQLLTGDSLKGRSIRGSAFTALSFVGQNGVRLAGNLVLTRILFPEAFGIMALIQVVLAGLNMFSDLGFRASIIKDARGTDPVYLDTAWTLQIARGLLLWLATWIAAAPVAGFYEVPELAEMLPVVGLTALIQGFQSTKMVTVNKALQLGRLTALMLGTQVLGLIVTVALALWLQSVWALVWGALVAPLAMSVLSHLVLPGAPNRLRFEGAAARNLIGFGAFIFLASATNFLSLQADRAILGKFVTLEVLALYNIAFFLATVPQKLMAKLVDVILFPLYAARPPRESAANLANLAKARAMVIAVSMFGAGALAVIGDSLVSYLYDARYVLAGPLLVLIAVAHLPAIATANYSTAILAAGDSGRFAIYMALSAGLKTALYFVGILYFGVAGLALAPFAMVLLFYPVSVWLIRPYKVWLPWHDLGFFVLSVAIGALAFWINWPRLVEAIEVFGA